MKIIKRPIFTEKTIYLIERNNQYIFDIDYQLTKPELFLLIEKKFLFFQNLYLFILFY